ncbi:MAG: cation-translocating P-type ATPase [Deltaproteobacteria bacterium]|nr:cation-translocating P-type ATPase [Deltaproteobacteria bacterium]
MKFHTASSEDALKQLSSTINGLSDREATQRLTQYGPNEVRRGHEISLFQIFFSQFNSFIVYILIAAVVISLILGEFIDAAVIIAILIVNAVLGFFQEYRAEKAIESLKKMAALQTTVIRDGRKMRIDSTRVVPGDLMVFEAGDRIAADGRIIEQHLLEVMEASLTGESHPVAKGSAPMDHTTTLGDMTNMVFGGTHVVNGSGRAMVVGTGMKTEMGKIAASIESVEDDETPLQKSLDRLARRLGILTVLICGVIIAFGVAKGGNILEMIMVGVSLAVAAVPEGLPIVVTIALALGVKRMVGQNALVKRLPSVETLGCTTVICTDKTGTLTRNEMTVTRLFVDHETIDVTGTGYTPIGEFFSSGKEIDPAPAQLLLRIGALNNDAAFSEAEGVIGDPTEACLLVSAAKGGLDKASLEKAFPRINEIPFDSERKRKSTVHRSEEGLVMYTKGAPDVIRNLCSRIHLKGEARLLNDDDRDRIDDAIQRFASEALRVLAFAYKPVSSDKGIDSSDESDLVFVGLQGMMDPPREEVKAAIQKCKSAGIRSVMITGDYALTAEAIAARLGIQGDAISGEQIEKMDDDMLASFVSETSIFSRVNPEHKIRIVRALRKLGEVVAMSGDGVNDAPALKEADIGIAMGITGTDVTKETAEMVLLDDQYTSIVKAVEQGRAIYENIKKFVNYLLSSNLGEVLILFVAMMIGFRDASGAIAMPLLATQILWLNLITDGLPAIALGVDPVRKGVMDVPPRSPQEPVITKGMAINIVVIAILMAAGVLFLFHRFLPEGETVARTVAFTSIVVFEMVRVTMIRTQYRLSFFSNLYLVGAIFLSLLLQVAVVYVPVMNVIFKTTPLAARHWGYMGAVTVAIFIVGMVAARLIARPNQ